MGLFDFFGRKRVDEPSEDGSAIPKVVMERTRMLEGRSIFSIIENGRHFLVQMPVYEDGVVDCWGMVDIATLAEKVAEGWVSPLVPDGALLSIFHLGELRVQQGAWLSTKATYVDFIRSVVQEMNPHLENLLVMGQRQGKLIGNVNYSAFGNSGQLLRQDSPEPNWKQQKGEQMCLFWKDSKDRFRIVRLVIYADGKVVIVGGPEPWAGDRAAITQLASEGKLLSEVPVGATVSIAQLGHFVVGAFDGYVKLDDKLKEIDDIVAKLNGRPDSGDLCAAAFEAYEQLPDPSNLRHLQATYDAVPAHLKIYILGDMDNKDWPIRSALGLNPWRD